MWISKKMPVLKKMGEWAGQPPSPFQNDTSLCYIWYGHAFLILEMKIPGSSKNNSFSNHCIDFVNVIELNTTVYLTFDNKSFLYFSPILILSRQSQTTCILFFFFFLE